ncbi:MAG: ECF-type sigma factor [Planctomycetota bacterium]
MGDQADQKSDATVLLQRASEGDAKAAEDLFPIVYDELRARAQAQFRNQPKDHTLQPTALVHEAFVKMIRSDGSWNDRAHFFAIASTAMRQILVDHARSRQVASRAQKQREEVATSVQFPSENQLVDLLTLDDVLQKLSGFDPERARIVELRFFGGLSLDEVADMLEMSRATIVRRWREIRAWLSAELSERA